MPGDLIFSADVAAMDVERVYRWLSEESYWALGRTRDMHQRAMAGSRNYGVFDDDGQQRAYARAITDGATWRWVPPSTSISTRWSRRSFPPCRP